MKIDRTTYVSRAYGSRIRLLVMHSMNIDLRRGMEILTQQLSSHYVIADSQAVREITTPKTLSAARRRSSVNADKSESAEVDRSSNICDGEAKVFGLVSETERAWHAGVGGWGGRADINDRSIGIEVCGYFDPADDSACEHALLPSPRFTDSETTALCALSRDILDRYPDITPLNVVAHSDVSIGRKFDPGRFFPWRRLFEHGVGAWPESSVCDRLIGQLSKTMPAISEIQGQLGLLGYIGLEETGTIDDVTSNAIRAFQLHWRPRLVTGCIDVETLAILQALLLRYR